MTPLEMPDFLASMRIEVDELEPIASELWDVFAETYQYSRMSQCIQVLRKELKR